MSLAGRRAGILGLGGIGQALARPLAPFGMQISAVTRTPGRSEYAALQLQRVAGLEDLEGFLASSDYLFLALPLTPETNGLVGGGELATLPRGAFLLNAARAAIINYTALVGALRSGHLGGAALDVFWDEPPPPSDRC